jgi:hypothetical protein
MPSPPPVPIAALLPVPIAVFPSEHCMPSSPPVLIAAPPPSAYRGANPGADRGVNPRSSADRGAAPHQCVAPGGPTSDNRGAFPRPKVSWPGKRIVSGSPNVPPAAPRQIIGNSKAPQ